MTHHYFGKWASNPPKGEEVVISGASGLFPESKNIKEYGDNLMNKMDMVTDDGRRWTLDHPEIPQRHAKIFGIDTFDPGFFGIHYRQSNTMDPMMRKSLECSVEAVMDAGINPLELQGSRTGVFVGACFSDMEFEILTTISEPQRMGITGYLRSLIANRISYYLKLKGPSYVVDTACSSSANALEQAFKCIRTGQCDNALVGTSILLMHPRITLQFYRLGVLSDDGRCKVFDQQADGYVRGETIGFIFIQKAKDAKRIYGEIIYAKVNSDGFKLEGITFPSSQMQEQLMNEIFLDTGLSPSDLSFLEAHGTGTKVGDPQEVEAIDNAIGKKRDKPLLIGSVKGNVGHTEPASGLCSLIKIITAMETGRIPPNINLKKLREGLSGIKTGRLKVVIEPTELEDEEAIVGVNNFGFGGNNCHFMLKRFHKMKINGGLPDDDISRLVCVSGRTKDSVLAILDELNGKPIDTEYIGLLHELFGKRNDGHLYRGFTILSREGRVENSACFLKKEPSPLFIYFGHFDKDFQNLGQYLLNFPVFKSTMSRINDYLLPKNINILEIITKNVIDNKDSLLGTVAIQIGILDILNALKLNITAVYGDSLGKFACAYYYNEITVENAITTAYKTIKFLPTDSKVNFEQTILNLKVLTNDYRNLTTNTFNHFTILNLSDECLNSKELRFVVNSTITFLDALAKMYEKGHSLHLEKLYPKIEYPVSRGTPMISPFIKWNHQKSWYTYKFSDDLHSNVEQQEIAYCLNSEQYRYLSGHVIDGRTLFPAMGYLHLVWEVYVHSRKLMITDVPIVFDNCKFVRACTMPPAGFITFLVTIHRGSGYFEIVENNTVVVTGKIFSPKNVALYQSNIAPITSLDQDRKLTLEEDEIYREMYLRGYNYSGLFKGIVKCNVSVTCSEIRWENNWITFMDKMLQMKILQMDTRSLYVPIGIKRLVVNPSELLAAVVNEKDSVIPVHFYEECDMIRSPGVEITGILANSISRKKIRTTPVLEKHEFVPNEASYNLANSLRINIQIILENSLEVKFKAVEINDSYVKDDSQFLLPMVKEILEDLPMINPDLSISSKSTLEKISSVKVKDFTLTSDSNLLLFIGTKILQRPTLEPFLNSLSPRGFLLTREEIDYIPNDINNIEIVTQFVTQNEKLMLLRKSKQLPMVKHIKVRSDYFDWIPKVKNLLKEDVRVILYCQNEELSGILGLVNCLRREPGSDKINCFFILGEAPEFDPQDPFYRNQIKKDLAQNVYQNSKWGTYRHLLLDELEEIECEHCYVNTTSIGDLSSLRWIEGPHTLESALQKKVTAVQSYYASLNFRDIMLASGRIASDHFSLDRTKHHNLLGLEFSGRDQSGKRVFGVLASKALSTIVITEEDIVWEVPEKWTLEDAVTVPAVYSTVIYALFAVTTIKAGTSILIHSASGGIGIAALNVCLHHGCEIFVTVGTQEKREFLKAHFPQIPDNHIGNSRDTTFENMIKVQTNGRGVDIVLNSLSEEKLMTSIRCLAKGGSFLEIGKYDLALNSSLNLLLMIKECSYHGIMVDKILANSLKIRGWICHQLFEGIKVGFVKPLPRTVFKYNEIETAFRYMTTGKHIGKVLVCIRKEEVENKSVRPVRVVYSAVPRFNCNPEKSYIIIGGLGGFGIELADWLMLRGAKKLILVSSSGIKSGYQTQRIRIWESHQVAVHISTADITNKQGCISLIREASQIGDVDGIFNLAVVLKDALFEDQTEENFRISLAPKAQATIYLDQVTRELCPNLRYFVVFSSVSCGRGNAGQSNYGMANSIMERICEKRKQDGFPALAIQWGAIGEVGLVAKMQKENKELVIGGTLQQKVSSCIEVLDKFLNQEHPVVASMIVAEKKNKNYDSGSVVEAAADILGIKDLKTINLHANLAELGMDSMTGTELLQVLEKDYDIYISVKDIRSLTFAKLIEIEAEKKKNCDRKNIDKSEHGINLFMHHIPDHKAGSLSIVRVPSGVADDDEAMTVFVLPGLEGAFKPLEPLTSNLKAHVFIVQYSYHNPEDTIGESSNNILPYIEKNLKKGENFYMIGYSYGAVVAIEIAALLEASGYNGNVVAIDGAPEYLRESLFSYVETYSEAVLETMVLLRLLEQVLPVKTLLDKKDKFMECKTYEERLNLATSLIPAKVAEKVLNEQGVIVLYKRVNSVVEYKFSHAKIKSSISLIKPTFRMLADIDDDYKLSAIFERPVQVIVVDGNHSTMLEKPELVEHVNELLITSS